MKKMVWIDLLDLMNSKCFLELKERLDQMNAVDAAEFLEELPEEKRPLVFRLLDKDLATDVFAQLSQETSRRLVNSFSDREVAQVVEDLSVDDAVDFLGELPASVVNRVLRGTSPHTRELVNRYLLYPKGSAGSMMTAEFVDLHSSMTVDEALSLIHI